MYIYMYNGGGTDIKKVHVDSIKIISILRKNSVPPQLKTLDNMIDIVLL